MAVWQLRVQLECVLVCVIVADHGLCVFVVVYEYESMFVCEWEGSQAPTAGVSECKRMCQFVKSFAPTTPTFSWSQMMWAADYSQMAREQQLETVMGVGIEEGCWAEVQGDKFGPGRGSWMWEVLHHLSVEASLWSHLVLISW